MKNTMTRAHEIREQAARKWNCKKSEIVFSICLKMAHAGEKLMTLDELKRKMVEYDDTHNDGHADSYNPYRDQLIEMQARIAEAKDVTWTKEVTIARRQEWKKWVLANAKASKINAKQLNEKTIEQGWNLEALKNAVKKHNL